MVEKTKGPFYYTVRSSAGERGSGWELVNRERLQPNGGGLKHHVAWPDGPYVLPRGPWSMPNYLEPPHFVCDRRYGNSVYDFDTRDGFFVVSAKMKSIFDDLAPGACEYRKCVTHYANGSAGPELWLCSVVQAFRNAVDVEASENLRVAPLGFYRFAVFEKASLAFKTDAIGSSHVFRVAEMASDLFCDEEFKSRCKAEKIRGISFKKIGFIRENNPDFCQSTRRELQEEARSKNSQPLRPNDPALSNTPLLNMYERLSTARLWIIYLALIPVIAMLTDRFDLAYGHTPVLVMVYVALGYKIVMRRHIDKLQQQKRESEKKRAQEKKVLTLDSRPQ